MEIINHKTIVRILQAIRTANRVAIFPHVSPDGDTIGSCYALGAMCRCLGVSSVTFYEDSYVLPQNSPPSGDVLVFDSSLQYDGFDTCIAVDCGHISRLGKRACMFNSADTTINIDHHASNDGFAKINLVEQVAATGEIVYAMFNVGNLPITQDVAWYLYYAIVTDTNRFQFSNTTPNVLRIAADLVEKGVNLAQIHEEIFSSEPLNKVRLTAAVLNTLEMSHDQKLAIMRITKDMFTRFDIVDFELDSLANLPINIAGVKIGVLIKEKTDVIKVSMRSKGEVNVSDICAKFGGGGHKNAAGFTSHTELEELAGQIRLACRDALVHK